MYLGNIGRHIITNFEHYITISWSADRDLIAIFKCKFFAIKYPIVKFDSYWFFGRQLRIIPQVRIFIPSQIQCIATYSLIFFIVLGLFLITCKVNDVKIWLLSQGYVVIFCNKYLLFAWTWSADKGRIFVSYINQDKVRPVILNSKLFIVAHIVIILCKSDINFVTTAKIQRLLLYLRDIKLSDHLINLKLCGNIAPNRDNFNPQSFVGWFIHFQSVNIFKDRWIGFRPAMSTFSQRLFTFSHGPSTWANKMIFKLLTKCNDFSWAVRFRDLRWIENDSLGLFFQNCEILLLSLLML